MKSISSIHKAWAVFAMLALALALVGGPALAGKKGSKGGKKATLVSLPDVVGQPRADADRILGRAGLSAVFEGNGTHVKTQDPGARSRVAKGSAVRLRLATPRKAKQPTRPKVGEPKPGKVKAPRWVIASVRAEPRAYRLGEPLKLRVQLNDEAKSKRPDKRVTLEIRGEYQDAAGKSHRFSTPPYKLAREIRGRERHEKTIMLKDAAKANGKDPIRLTLILRTGGKKTDRKTLEVRPVMVPKGKAKKTPEAAARSLRKPPAKGGGGPGPHVLKATVGMGTILVDNSPGPVVEVTPEQPFDVQWDVSSVPDADHIDVYIQDVKPYPTFYSCDYASDVLGAPVVGSGVSGALNVEPSPPIQFDQRREVWACIRDASNSLLGTTNRIEIVGYNLNAASQSLPPLQITGARAYVAGGTIRMTVELRNNSLTERTRTAEFIRITPCAPEPGQWGTECSNTFAYVDYQFNVPLPPGQVVSTEIDFPVEDVSLDFAGEVAPGTGVPVMLVVGVTDNLGGSGGYRPEPLTIAPDGFDLRIRTSALLRRGVVAGLFAKDVRFWIEKRGTDAAYLGPLPMEVLSPNRIRLRCPDGNFLIQADDEISIDCTLKYDRIPTLRRYAGENLRVVLNVVDDYAENNRHVSDWVINTYHRRLGDDVKIKDLQVINNHSPNPTIKFKVKNKSRRRVSDYAPTGRGTEPMSTSGVYARAYLVGGGSDPIWGPEPVGGDGRLDENEAVLMYIPGDVLPVGRHQVKIQAYFPNPNVVDYKPENNVGHKNYHKKPGGSVSAADLKIKNVTRHANNSSNVRINFTVKNKGGSNSSGYTIRYAVEGTSFSHMEDGPALPAGAKQEHEISDMLPVGNNNKLEIEVVSNNLTEELNTNNNTATKNYKKPVTYDLKVKNVRRDRNRHSDVKITFDVKNRGAAESPDYCVEYSIEGRPGEDIPPDCRPDLSPGNKYDHEIQGNLPGTGNNNWTLIIRVVPSSDAGNETNTNNNTKTKNYKKPN